MGSLLLDAGKFECDTPEQPDASEGLPATWAVALLQTVAGPHRRQLDGAPSGCKSSNGTGQTLLPDMSL